MPLLHTGISLLGCGSLKGLVLLGTVISPPQLKSEEATLGSNSGSSCSVHYQYGQGLIPVTVIYPALFD